EHLPGVGPEGVTPVASVGVSELCGRSMVVQRSNSPTKPQIAHRLRAEAAVLGPPRPPAGAGRAGEHSPGPAHCRPRQLPGRAGRPRRPHPMGHGSQRRHRLGEETPHGGRVDRSQRHEHVAPGRIEPLPRELGVDRPNAKRGPDDAVVRGKRPPRPGQRRGRERQNQVLRAAKVAARHAALRNSWRTLAPRTQLWRNSCSASHWRYG
ncbi:MAG: hypothetical protein QOF81_3296, partial [Acidimicrobiaceae bacterium]|nr:hypothetical protein [Acidimicrobiaceae bacterium]